MNRWIVYQRERFPVLSHGIAIGLYTFCALSFSAAVRGVPAAPDPVHFLAAFTSAFVFFLQLRIADEFKDKEIDARYRAHRPVPRGLVTLSELATVAVAGAAMQLAIAIWVDSSLVPLLALVWVYLGLMTTEFFVPRWLKARPVSYLLSHMFIVPLITLYLTAFDWIVAGASPSADLGWLLATSFLVGLVFEIGRKIRPPGEEREGVETYSALWGLRAALCVWQGALIATLCAGVAAGILLGSGAIYLVVLGGALLLPTFVAWRLIHRPETASTRVIERLSALAALLVYSGLSALALGYS